MAQELQGFRVAILAENGVEEVELTEPKRALEEAGATARVVSPEKGRIKAWNFADWGREIPVDAQLDTVRPDDFDALLLPGGVMNPDRLRMNPRAVAFTRSFFDSGKPVASICHGPWMLVEADVVRGGTLTSWPSLKADIRNAGGNWVDREVIRDREVVTSRKPDDIPAFNREMIRMFVEARVRQPQARAAR